MTWYSSDEDKENSILGKTVKRLYVSDGSEALKFVFTDGEEIIWETWGDCCSSSWWNDITEVNALFGTPILEFEEVQMDDVSSESDWELIQAYGVKLTTQQGKPFFVFRNSSNGYYGGDFTVVDESAYSGWREITENDWSA